VIDATNDFDPSDLNGRMSSKLRRQSQVEYQVPVAPREATEPPTSGRSASAIRVEGVAKRFGSTQALAGVDLEIPEGTVFGLLGPNGAGKTTLVRILSTLIAPDSGRAEVLGHDVAGESAVVRKQIALTGQFAAIDEMLTGRENLEMFGRLFDLSREDARSRAARALRLGGRRGSPGADVFRWHAASARPGLKPPDTAADSLPRRADDRP
jgi:ABC-type glutathione transport system ATPase component